MALELLHLAQRRDHTEVEDRALARAQGVVAPGLAPAILGQDALKIAVEIVNVVERAVNILVAQHPAPLGQPAVVHCLIHVVSPWSKRNVTACEVPPPSDSRCYTEGVHRVPISASARSMVSTAAGGKSRPSAAP